MRKRNYARSNVGVKMITKKRKHKRMTIEERNIYEEDRIYQSMDTAKIYLTKRSQTVKVTLPRLKFMEREDV